MKLYTVGEKDHYHSVLVHEWEMNKLAPLAHEAIFVIAGKHDSDE
jgi:hypothetical protein